MTIETLYIRHEHGKFMPATGDDVVSASKAHLSRRMRRGTSLTSPRLVRDYLAARLGNLDCRRGIHRVDEPYGTRLSRCVQGHPVPVPDAAIGCRRET